MDTCEECQGNGEIVTDWDRYLSPHKGDIGDEAVAECPVCDGTGVVDSPEGSDGAMNAFTDLTDRRKLLLFISEEISSGMPLFSTVTIEGCDRAAENVLTMLERNYQIAQTSE